MADFIKGKQKYNEKDILQICVKLTINMSECSELTNLNDFFSFKGI